VDGVYSVSLGQNRDEMWVAVKTVMNFAFHKWREFVDKLKKMGC
jgi:hypothetical protein